MYCALRTQVSITPVTMRFFSKKGMVMGPLEHYILHNHVLPVDVSWRKCLIPMKSALSQNNNLCSSIASGHTTITQFSGFASQPRYARQKKKQRPYLM